jgi:hypothetical protein
VCISQPLVWLMLLRMRGGGKGGREEESEEGWMDNCWHVHRQHTL